MKPYWTCRRAPRDGQPGLIAVVLAAGPFEARDQIAPSAVVAPCELTSPDVLPLVADLAPGGVRALEVARLPSWRDAHGARLSSRSYCEGIGYDPT